MATTQTTERRRRLAGHPGRAGHPDRNGPDREFTVRARSQREQIVRHFLHNKVGMSGLVIFVAAAAVRLRRSADQPEGLRGPQRPRPVGAARAPRATSWAATPSAATCSSALMIGIQRSMLIVLLYVVIALPLGLAIGALAGYFGKWVDSVLMRIVDLDPHRAAVRRPGRRGQQLPERPHAAGRRHHPGGRSAGWTCRASCAASSSRCGRRSTSRRRTRSAPATRRIIFKHLIPNALGSIIVWTTLAAATAIILEASLTYLGFGVNGAEPDLAGPPRLRRRPGRRHPPVAVLLPRHHPADHRAVDQPDR